MRSRSAVHMLNVFAERLESELGNKSKTVEALRLVARDTTIRAAEHRNWTAEQERRVDRQRSLFNVLPSCGATDRLKEAMLQRAYDLLWDGDGLSCDALIEFLPSSDVDRMMSAWSEDQDGQQPKSQWYGGQK